jgi:Na+/proline symporter
MDQQARRRGGWSWWYLLPSCSIRRGSLASVLQHIQAAAGHSRPEYHWRVWSDATLALGSALALFLYPHSITGIPSASSGRAVRKNAALLPAYSFLLVLLALVGFFAIAAGVSSLPEYAAGFNQFGNNFAVPALFLHSFPSWFVGIAFAAVGIGALVPAAIMSIAANLYTRNIHREFINRAPTDRQQVQMATWVSLISSSARCFSLSSCHRNLRSTCNSSGESGSFRLCPR